MKHKLALSLAAAAALALCGAGRAQNEMKHDPMEQMEHDHGGHEHAQKPKETAFGRPANPKAAARTIKIEMSDALRFTPSELAIKKGETVRFSVKNSGKLVHEMVLGTMDELKEHAEMMQKDPRMKHKSAHELDVEPGKTRTLSWQFTKAGEFYYGCLVPGHFEAGMVGKIVVR